MNDKKKSVIILGLLLCLIAVAQQGLFIKKIKTELVETRSGFIIDSLEDAALPDSAAEAPDAIYQEDVERLEHRLRLANVVKYIFIVLGVATLGSSFFLRSKKQITGFEDEWEDEEWEDDEDNET